MISAQEINKLRQQTGAGMMDCKKALTEAGGYFEKAIEILRKKGHKVAASRADKATTAGAVWAKTNDENNYGVMISLSCETDFVAKNETFLQLGQIVLEAAFTQQPATIAMLLQANVGGLTLQEKFTELMGKISEKITINGYTSLSSDIVVPYIHMGNKLGVLVGLKGSHGPKVIEVSKDLAMQIAAMNPLAVDKDDIDPAILEKELAIAKEQARNEGKNEAMIERVAQGRLNKFFQEKALLNQVFVKDNSLTIAQYLANVSPQLTINAFKRMTVAD